MSSTMRHGQLRSDAAHHFSGTDVWQLVCMRAATQPNQPCFTWQPFEGEARTWSFGELATDAAAVAAGLAQRGITSGDRVLIHLENSPEFIISWYACAALGAVAVTTNTRSAPDELQYFVQHCGAAGAITQPRFAEVVGATSVPWVVSTDHDAGIEIAPGRRPDRDSSFHSLRLDPRSFVARAPDPMAPMSVQYTSGTTARPKGVLWTHANALWGARVNARNEALRPDDCHLVYLPLFHTNALAYSMLASMWVGARMVVIPKWSTSRFWDISLRHGCTWLSLIGLSGRALIDNPAPDQHSYRLFGTGVCDHPELDLKYGVKTVGWWGMTETIAHPIVGDPYTPNRPMSMGRPSPEYGIAVVRDDGVTPVEPEETGQLLVRGTPGLSLFAGYLSDADATKASFDESGWFRTGDLVTPHGDGHITFADRAKDMLKVGSENVAASEVEQVVLAVPGVREVAVVGRSDDKLDEVPVVFVTADGRTDGLSERVIAACATKLADFKVPRAVYVVRDMPRSTLNKVNKVELRKVSEPSADRAAAEASWLTLAGADPSGEAE